MLPHSSLACRTWPGGGCSAKGGLLWCPSAASHFPPPDRAWAEANPGELRSAQIWTACLQRRRRPARCSQMEPGDPSSGAPVRSHAWAASPRASADRDRDANNSRAYSANVMSWPTRIRAMTRSFPS